MRKAGDTAVPDDLCTDIIANIDEPSKVTQQRVRVSIKKGDEVVKRLSPSNRSIDLEGLRKSIYRYYGVAHLPPSDETLRRYIASLTSKMACVLMVNGQTLNSTG